MSDETKISFSYEEVIQALLRAKGVSEGIWSISFEFALGATQIGPNDKELRPCAIVPVVSIGLARSEKLTNLSVDASTISSTKAVVVKKTASKKKATVGKPKAKRKA